LGGCFDNNSNINNSNEYPDLSFVGIWEWCQNYGDKNDCYYLVFYANKTGEWYQIGDFENKYQTITWDVENNNVLCVDYESDENVECDHYLVRGDILVLGLNYKKVDSIPNIK
jgi:hypothetical protein